MTQGIRNLAATAWLALGLSILIWLSLHRAAGSALLWIAMLAPIVAMLPGMYRGWPHAFALPMLASIVYAVIGMMELVASVSVRWPSALLTATAFIAFFSTIPATRQGRRQDTP